MNVNIRTFKASVLQEFLYDMEEEKKGWSLPCIVFGLTSYMNETLTFQIMMEDGSMFSYIPFHALRFSLDNQDMDTLDLKDLVYHNCRNLEMEYHVFDHLKGKVECYFKHKNLWMSGDYYATIDFYTGNDMLHIVKLENGQIAALPTHKVKFKEGSRDFPGYKKLHATWRV